MSNKTYNLNGKEVDGYGDIIRKGKTESILNRNQTNNKNTAAKLGTRIIAIALIVSSIAMYKINIDSKEYSDRYDENISIAESISTQIVVPSEYNFLYTDTGEKYVIDELSIKENLDRCNACKVDGIYYSRNTDNLVVLKVTQKYTTVVEPTMYTSYVAPAGYVVVGNKCYKIEDVEEATKEVFEDGTVRYIAPEGYVLIGNKAVKSSAINEGVEPESQAYYQAPSGYTLQDGKAVKVTQYTTEYLLTQEEYENKEYDHLIEKNGEYINHSVEIVEARPMSELYAELGIEYSSSQKLTK